MRKQVAAIILLGLISTVAFGKEPRFLPTQIQAMLDAGQIDEALESLNRRLKKSPGDADALFLRSTALIMDGNLSAGRRDLAACLEIDPTRRSAWLNRAALDLAEADYAAAVEAFVRAEALDPEAPDNSLNIGAALLFKGDRDQASQRFQKYLQANPDNAGAYYLVAANYAMAARPELAVPLLSRAVQLDEKTRLRARTDANFAVLADNSDFQELLNTDSYRPGNGAPTAVRSFDHPYTGRDSRVLEATLTALQRAGYPISSGVEVTPLWALIWSDVRIKIAANENAGTDVMLSAEPGVFNSVRWKAKTDEIFRRITLELHSRLPRAEQ
jgi:tetratricopeptide (TPR) repeat protein